MRDSRGEKTPSGVTVIIVALFRSRNEGVNGCGVASAVHPPTDWIRSTDTLSVLMSLSKAKPNTHTMKVYVMQKKTHTFMSLFVSSLNEIDKRTYRILSIKG
jgi:hypothetical protein